MKKKTTDTTFKIRLSNETYQALSRYAKSCGLPKSRIVRELIDKATRPPLSTAVDGQ